MAMTDNQVQQMAAKHFATPPRFDPQAGTTVPYSRPHP